MKSHSPTICINLHQAIYALADALDLVGVDELGHGKRVAFMARECAVELGIADQALNRLFHAGLLHDCGVSSTRVHQHLVEKFEWDEVLVHCEIGYSLLAYFEPLADLATIIRHHHTHWQDLQDLDMPEEDRLFANLIFLVDRVDALSATSGEHILTTAKRVRRQIEAYSGTHFAPELVDAFLKVSSAEAFWLTLAPHHLQRYLIEMEREELSMPMDTATLKRFARIFAFIVDAKSSFTLDHSEGVASLARHLGELSGLSSITCDKLEIAGLLHDLGKLKVPDEILEKNGPLTEYEASVMHCHSYESYQILRRLEGLGDVALWAAYHHESPSGNGYPFHAKNGDLGIEPRIIAVADVFQALAQDRPYRSAMNINDILSILQDRASKNRLDPEIVALVEQNADTCMHRATRYSRNGDYEPIVIRSDAA